MIAWNRGVGAQRHRGGGRGWAEELGQICGGVRKPSALAPAYQDNNLYMVVNRLFYKSEEIFILYNFRKQNTCIEAVEGRTFESGFILLDSLQQQHHHF